MANFEEDNQLRILDLPGAVPPGQEALPIRAPDVGFPDQDRSDDSMLKEATQNRALSEAFEASRGLIGTWNLSELMLRAYVEPIKWKGSDQFRSHLGIPILAEHFYSILATVQQTLFSGYRPFQIDPAAGTSIDAAAAQEALITAQMKHCGYKGGSVKQEVRHVVYDGLLYGTGVAMEGWQVKKYSIKKKRSKTPATSVPVAGGAVDIPTAGEDDIEDAITEIEINEPVFEHVPIRRVRVAPDCRRGEIETASWRGRLIYLSSYDLDDLRETEGYNIPSREELVKLTTPQKMDSTGTNPLDTQGAITANPVFQQTTTPQKAYPESGSDGGTVDPLAKKWEVFEYVTDTRVAWILEGQLCIRNESHNKSIRFRSFVFREAPDSFYGYGLGFWLADYQRIAQGVVNAFFDDVNLNLMGTYTAPAGLNNTAQAQWIFPGKVFKSDGQVEVKQMVRNSISSQEPLGIIEQVRQWAVLTSGAGIGVQGAQTGGQSGPMRNPAGVNLMASGEAIKNQDLIDQICDGIFVPWIEYCIEMNSRLKPSQLRQMLSQELGEAFKSTPMNVINGDYKVTISAGAKLAARMALDQALGFISSIIQSPNFGEMLAIQGMKVNAAEFLKMVLESRGYPYRENVIVPMTDDDQKRWQAQQQQPGQKIQEIMASGEVKKKVDDNQAENRMLLQVGKHVTDTAKQTVEQEAEDRRLRMTLQAADAGESGAV